LDAPEPADVSDSANCGRADLSSWCERGGVLPERLAAHIQHCAPCADRVRRASEVHLALKLMCTETAARDLTAQANARALRFLRKAARASAAARRLLRSRPDLTRWQKAHLHLARLSMGAAAACLTLIVRAGVNTGFEHTRQIGDQLASQHWQRHIDPDGEWMGPRGMT
jgi:hypothetical protein